MAIVLDLFNREAVGWSLKPRMTADIVTDALTMAWFRRKPAAGLIHHSDRGSQYASRVFQGKLKEYGMICSMPQREAIPLCGKPHGELSQPQGKLLGQCPERKLVRQLQKRAGVR